MGQYVISGRIPLRGSVAVNGAKNSALGIIAAAIMCNEDVTIRNMPDVSDIRVMLNAIETIGAQVTYPDENDRHVVVINGSRIINKPIDQKVVAGIRASYYLIGALLGKYKEASVAEPEGCGIGDKDKGGKRPTDLHEYGFRRLGAMVWKSDDFINARGMSDRLVGNRIDLAITSVGATINIMLAASMAEGRTEISNAACEPHVVDIANFLNCLGAKIRGAGTNVIRIDGVPELKPRKPVDYEIIPDQIEAGTFMCAAAATMGDVKITHVIPQHLRVISDKLADMGAIITEGEDFVRVQANKRLQPTKIRTEKYPGFPTDMQSQMTACLAIANGNSKVKETVWENRFEYTEELKKMGADIQVRDREALIVGQEKLHGARVRATDLRAGAALVIAGLAAHGITYVEEIKYIQRGYEDFEGKIKALGGKILMTEFIGDVDIEATIKVHS